MMADGGKDDIQAVFPDVLAEPYIVMHYDMVSRTHFAFNGEREVISSAGVFRDDEHFVIFKGTQFANGWYIEKCAKVAEYDGPEGHLKRFIQKVIPCASTDNELAQQTHVRNVMEALAMACADATGSMKDFHIERSGPRSYVLVYRSKDLVAQASIVPMLHRYSASIVQFITFPTATDVSG